MAVSIQTFKVNADGGDVLIRFQALKGLPIEGVLSSFDRQVIEAEADDEPTYTTFRVPAEAKRYVAYGVITPTKKLWGAPKYDRLVLQGDLLAVGGAKNPTRVKTRKINAGEYVGPPEILSIEVY